MNITKIEHEVKMVRVEYECLCGGKLKEGVHYKNHGIKVCECMKCGKQYDIPEKEIGVVPRDTGVSVSTTVEVSEAKKKGLCTEW